MARNFRPIYTSILSAAASAINPANPVGLTHVAPGLLAAWDDCCSGQLYLRTIEVYPTAGRNTPFPQFDAGQPGVGCGVNLLAFHLALGVIRCAHTIDDNGTPPTADEMTGDAFDAIDDLSLLLDVISCDLLGLPGIMGVKVGRWQPQGVQGGCHGGEWDFYAAVDPCICTPVEVVEG